VTTIGPWLVVLVSAYAGLLPDFERVFALSLIAGAVVGHVYTLIPTAVWGQTLGKYVLRIRVVRSDTFDVPGWKRAAIRTLGLIPLSMLPFGSVMATAGEGSFLFTRTRQGLHDMFAGTIVVDDQEWQRWRHHADRPRRPRTRRTS
jgi:uncharacterized RDD family membrane protein YckC